MNFKKYFLITFLCGIFVTNLSFAQDTKNTTENINIHNKSENRIFKLGMQFSKTGTGKAETQLNLQIRPGEKKSFYVVFFNSGNTGELINFGFSKGLLNKDGFQVCDQNIGNDNDFSKFIEIEGSNQKIEVKPGSLHVSKIYIQIPKNLTGKLLGCSALEIEGLKFKQPGSIFEVLPRRTANIEINITGNVYSPFGFDNIKNHKDTILKIITLVIALGLIISIIQQIRHKKKKHKAIKNKK